MPSSSENAGPRQVLREKKVDAKHRSHGADSDSRKTARGLSSGGSAAAAANRPNYEMSRVIEKCHEKGISGLAFSPTTGSILASSSADATVKLWNAESGNAMGELSGHESGISDLSWSANERYICTASDDTTVKVWDTEREECIQTLVGHTQYAFCCKQNHQSNLIVSGSFDGAVKVWDVRSGKCIRTLLAHSDPVTSVDFNRDGTLIVSSSYDRLIRLWETSSGQCMKTLIDDNASAVGSAKFSPNGKYLLSGTLDGTLRLWDFYNGKRLKTYRGHVNEKFCIQPTFAVTSGKWIISGSEDSSVYVWDLNTKEIAQKIKGDDDGEATVSVAAHPTKTILASATMGDSAQIRFFEHRPLKK